ncbi:hypothetical protein Rs2_20580 [Raphanus sativus]|uniref:Uncharacterized protein LOC108856878 n=1 Tax=Raphanus sativus TaxID=3726 RepID=A0A6J0NRF8_RAPSA|nr:uncharacterized protein LOC108856878 [Raphanus sativus]KAJ4893786.1 hypothetical protein Rs2_20580 [Raphanus sativus]
MYKHKVIPSWRPKKAVRRTPLMMKLSHAREFSLADVRRCLYDQTGRITMKECRYIFRHARLKTLAKNPLRTLRGYNDELEMCLRYGNKEAHYIEGVKQFFALHDRPRGMRHLKFSAEKQYKKGNYLYAILKMLAGDHVVGMNLLDLHKWRNNTYSVDKVWKQVKRTLHEVPIIKRRTYGTNMILIMPPRSCNLKDIKKRCTKCFYYKEMEKFLELVYRG